MVLTADRGPRRRRSLSGLWGRCGALAAIGLLVACGACAPADADGESRWLRDLRGPSTLVLGSSVRVQGVGLAGALLRLRTDAGDGFVRLRPAITGGREQRALGADAADGDLGWRDGEVVQVPQAAAVRAVCVTTGESGADVGACMVLPSPPAANSLRFGPLDGLTAPTLTQAGGATSAASAPAAAHVGGTLVVVTTGLPLSGEGAAWLELEDRGGAVPLAAGATVAVRDVPWSRDRGQIDVAAAGFGVVPGVRRLRLRVARQMADSKFVEFGPWSDDTMVDVTIPALTWPQPGQPGLVVRRGRATALTWQGGGCPSDAALEVHGMWSSAAGVVVNWPADAPRSLSFRRAVDGKCSATLLAADAMLDGWTDLGMDAVFEGQAAIRVGAWRGAEAAIALRLAPSPQVVELQFEPGVALGLHRFGLAHAAALIEARTRALVQEHAQGLNLHWVEQVPGDVVEFMPVRVLGDDPNGLGLLGTEPSRGKDDGNRRWDEAIGGFCPDAWLAGVPAWGGVFVSSFLRFSPTLSLTSGADPRFDAIFGPFAPELGGAPVQDAVGLVAAAAAIEAVSQLLAGTLSHEVGHALGLAAGTSEFHHPTDNPGWRMDAGTARPFAERAALPGAQAEDWGPIDRAYLESTLAP